MQYHSGVWVHVEVYVCLEDDLLLCLLFLFTHKFIFLGVFCLFLKSQFELRP